MNELGQPIGQALEDFQAPPRPNFTLLQGSAAKVTPIKHSHLSQLYTAFSADFKGENWTYLPYGPFLDEANFI